MGTHLGKVVLAVLLTHGFRSVGRRLGPRWAGLALGLPCSSAVALVGGGAERGIADSVTMAGTCLIGLVGSVTIPLAFAVAIGRGWRLSSAVSAALGSYLAVIVASGRLVPNDGWACLALALGSVLGATYLAARMGDRSSDEPGQSGGSSTVLAGAIRSAMPAACVLGSLAMGGASGPELAGLFATFPGVSLTLLVLTHLESGPTAASRMARALPAGNLAMIAFLAAFRADCPSHGLARATALGYASALVTLAIVVKLGPRLAEVVRRQPSPEPITWPRSPRRFAPIVEAFAG